MVGQAQKLFAASLKQAAKDSKNTGAANAKTTGSVTQHMI